MAWAAVAGAAVSVVGGAVQANAARKAANQQGDAARAAAAQLEQKLATYDTAGKDALGNITTGLGEGGKYSKRFTMADATNSDAEQFALQQGSQAIQNSAASKGGLIGSNVLQDLTQFGQKNASQFQQQAFDQWNKQNQQELSANQHLVGIGENAAAGVGNSNANATLATGGAQAGATAATGSAINNTLGQVGNILGQSNLFKPNATPTTPGMTSGNISPGGDYNIGVDDPVSTLSDERLKTDIEQVGQTNDGLPIYKYRMKGTARKIMGVMATDVERVRPDAITRSSGGYRMVDYNKVS